MTIAQIIAAKKAAAASQPKPAPAPPQPTTADLELEGAIDRIDPPALGKRRAGLILSSKTPLPKAEIAEKAAHAERRSISLPAGEAIPMVPLNADKEMRTWHEALNAFESELCVMRDPKESEVIWLAVRSSRKGMPPILLHRLPWLLWDYPRTPTDLEPF